MTAFGKMTKEEIADIIAVPFSAWNMTATGYSQSEQIDVVDGCFAIMFTNIGDTAANVNGVVIFPSATPAAALGDSRSIGGHYMGLYKGNITLTIQAPVGVAPRVEIIQLFYVKEYKPRD
jgi:hypothetical protein